MALMHFYTLDWQQSGDGRHNLLLVSDASSPCLHMAGIEGYRHILVIGHTQAELFGDHVGDSVVVEIEEFKYRTNFAVVAVKSKNQCLDIARTLSRVGEDGNRYPFLVLTGSKKEQIGAFDKIGDKAHPSREGGEKDQEWLYSGGFANIFYSNSVISRGLDLPQYNALIAIGGDFAIPYWSAVIHNQIVELNELKQESPLTCAVNGSSGGEMGGEDYKRMIESSLEDAEAIKNSLIRDEFTNSCMRIAPTQSSDVTRPKIVICSEEDLQKLDYLDDQVLKLDDKSQIFTTDSIVRLLRGENLTGHVIKSMEIVTEIDTVFSQAALDGTLPERVRSKLVVEDIPKRPAEVRKDRIEKTLQEDCIMTVSELAEELDEKAKNVRYSLVSLDNKVARRKVGHEYYWYLITSETGARSVERELKTMVKERKAAKLMELEERILTVLRWGGWMSMAEMRNNGLRGGDKDIRGVIRELVKQEKVLSERDGRTKKYVLNEKPHQTTLF